jgi:hypothetical protein
MLEDPIKAAAEGYIDNILTLQFDVDARARTLELLTRRADPSLERSRLDMGRARGNAIRFVQEAAKEARRRGAESVDTEAVQTAWVRLCPGLYPFC